MPKTIPKVLQIKEMTTDPTLNIVLDTLETKKQALVFCNSKRSCEKTAEDIANKFKIFDAKEREVLEKLSFDVLNALPRPTTQCERLARCVKKGIAYHHAGLVAEQKSLIEDAFRANVVKIICSTPTLAQELTCQHQESLSKTCEDMVARAWNIFLS